MVSEILSGWWGSGLTTRCSIITIIIFITFCVPFHDYATNIFDVPDSYISCFIFVYTSPGGGGGIFPRNALASLDSLCQTNI